MAKGKKRRRPTQQEPGEREAGKAEKANEPAARHWRRGRTRLIPRPKSPAGGVVELVVILALALVLALAIQAWLVKPYKIPSGSMEPTLDVGQRILANRFVYHFADPKAGDIVVFHPPAGADRSFGSEECGTAVSQGQPCPEPTEAESSENFVKRVVAGPGDRIRIIRGLAIVNGRVNPAVNDPADTELVRQSCGAPLPRSQWASVQADGRCNFPIPTVVPPGHYFMMGDNRGRSDDSRYWGPVPRSWIIGKAFATYWPPNRLGLF